MPKLIVFNSVSLDGYFTDAKNDMSWAHRGQGDPEWNEFVAGNAKGGGRLLFGRKTYEMMASFWPTPMAQRSLPLVAERMNAASKVVFSRTLKDARWNNTRLVTRGLVAEVTKMKESPGTDMVILGSGEIVAQLASEGLVDEYQFVIIPIALGKGRTLFDGMKKRLDLRLVRSRSFKIGNMLVCYEPAP
ncbi:MAG TPA: dihydrofolate reductase family protein [Opitutaceae bacterium]